MLGSYGGSQTGDSGLTVSRSVSPCNFLFQRGPISFILMSF